MSQNTQCNTARKSAYAALLEIERGAYANLALKKQLDVLKEQRDRSFITKLVYTTLDNKLYIDFIINHYAASKIQPAVRVLLRMSVCELLYLNTPASAACNEAVKLAKNIGKAGVGGFINGLLRKISINIDSLPQTDDISIIYSIPEHLLDMLIKDYGEKTTVEFLNYKPKNLLCIREVTPNSAAEFEYTKGNLCKDALYIDASLTDRETLFNSSDIAIQSESSMLVCKVLDPKPNMRILDACAAPGGKALYMAQLMQTGSITAWDIYPHRVELISKNCARYGANIIDASLKDASIYDENFDKSFDAVLVDAPCSGLGDMFSKPDIRYTKDAQMILQLANLQQKILSNCSQYVKVGGELVYSTCSLLKAENIEVIEKFLSNHQDFSIVDIDFAFREDFDTSRLQNGVQLLPHLECTEGFYICKMKRS